MFNRSQEAARRRRQMEAGNARVDAVRGHHGVWAASSGSGDNCSCDAIEVPAPKEGGTFFYCPYRMVTRITGVTVETCGWPDRRGFIKPRFRTLAAYRRHYRKYHS